MSNITLDPRGMPQGAVWDFLNKIKSLSNNLRLAEINRCYSDGKIGIGATATKLNLSASVTYKVNGEFMTAKGATNDLWTLSGLTAVSASKYQKYALELNASGSASVSEGTHSDTDAGVVLPALPASKSVIGMLTIQTSAGVTFTPGTTSLTATGVTATYTDGLPDEFFVASSLTVNQNARP